MQTTVTSRGSRNGSASAGVKVLPIELLERPLALLDEDSVGRPLVRFTASS